ncbi:hypothetical protein [Streptomyces sp. NPDC019937]|uniref:hypothetical protein n=1 Tax=Streptomyces sp. NPDC019937 TaxID=3154787 RepID=UPI0033ED3DFE
MWHPWKRRITELQARVAELAEQRTELRAELAESRAAVIRLAGRNDELSDRLELTRAVRGKQAKQLRARLDRVLRACARYRREGAEDQAAAMTAHQAMKDALDAADRARVAGADALRRLELSERARRDLDAQLAAEQKSNDFMCREQVTAAGTLTTPPADADKSSEVAR